MLGVFVVERFAQHFAMRIENSGDVIGLEARTDFADLVRETEDRVGLLYAISEVLAEFDLDISAAKILTEKGAAIDSFYVRELDGGKVLAPERQKAIERKLLQSIARLDAA